jgi:arsenite methyltransferase
MEVLDVGTPRIGISRMKIDYGQDAPGVVRGLLIARSLLAAAALIGHLMGEGRLARPITINLVAPAITLLATAMWMIWSSRFGKQRMVIKLLNHHAWRGDEVVLDIGCGRGLATIEAARRVHSGHVVGIDQWRIGDLSGNAPEAARANACQAGVAEKVSFDTGDATRLPFEDAAFDVVVSMTVFHNIKPASERRRTVEEALRVLRRGGTLLIFDILYTPAYAAAARSAGAQEVRLSAPAFLWALPGWFLTARKPPSGFVDSAPAGSKVRQATVRNSLNSA